MNQVTTQARSWRRAAAFVAFLVALMIALSLACAPRAWAAGNDESGQLVAQALNGVALGEVSSFDNISSDGYVVISEKNDNIFAMTATRNNNWDGLKGISVGSSDDGKYLFADLDTCRWYVEKLESGGLYVLRCSKGYLKCSEDDYLGFGFVFSLENSATDATPISIGTSGELLIGESALKLKYNNNGDFVVDEDGGSSAVIRSIGADEDLPVPTLALSVTPAEQANLVALYDEDGLLESSEGVYSIPAGTEVEVAFSTSGTNFVPGTVLLNGNPVSEGYFGYTFTMSASNSKLAVTLLEKILPCTVLV